jgi:hypothetical protein
MDAHLQILAVYYGEHQFSRRNYLAVDPTLAGSDTDPVCATFHQLDVDHELVPGNDGAAKLHTIAAHKVRQSVSKASDLHHQKASGLRHCLNLQNAWHDRLPREMTNKIRLVYADILDGTQLRVAGKLHHAVDQ